MPIERGERRPTILYVGPTERHFAELVRRQRVASRVIDRSGATLLLDTECEPVRVIPATGALEATECLRHEYVNAVLLDARCLDADAWQATRDAIREVLVSLDDTDDVEARYGFHRIVALVGGRAPAEELDAFLTELGRLGIHHVRRQRPGRRPADFEHDAICDTLELIRRRRRGRTALCASGGGITGIYFEIGALKCLDDALPDGVIHDFDMYFGISAGAVVLSLIANGYSPGELMAAVAGVDTGRVRELDLSMLRLVHLNTADMRRRFGAAARAAVRQAGTALRGELRRTVEDAFLEYTALVGPPFQSGAFEELLHELLTAPGASNDFRRMPGELYVGATDQDQRKHVLFGSDEWSGVSISRAVQASLSIHPAFASVEIGGRWYEDGAVTRTSGFVEAIRRDADLIFVLDPFVPYISSEAGAAHRKGVLYNLDQELRTISFTRFQSTRDWALRQHPHVSSYTFLPSNRSRLLLSVNPMDHRPYMAIFRDAYLSTLRRLERLQHRLRGDLVAHGISLDLDRARQVALRLRATAEPTLSDFFVGGRVDPPQRPLARERLQAARAARSAQAEALHPV